MGKPSWWPGTSVQRELSELEPLVAEVGQREAGAANLDERGLREAFAQLSGGGDSDGLTDARLIEGFALVREASRRALGMRPYDVQILAGLVIARGHLAEMQTGEGKTLAAVAPAAMLALSGDGIHVLTFNDYLARRDADWMRPIYRLLGLSVGFVNEGMSRDQRRKAYASDVTYLTGKEAGFDFLRDGRVFDLRDRVQRSLNAAIVDEADSILIDEARIPMVLAGSAEPLQTDPNEIARVVARLDPDLHYQLDEHRRNVHLSEAGIARVESALGIRDLYAPDPSSPTETLTADVQNALHARALLRRDVDYIVRDGKIELVDELTGRVADRRQWPDGLQAAVETKEELRAQPEGRVLCSITLQHFLRHYHHLAGMTATASSAAEELIESYQLLPLAIPTHRPCVRIDHPDEILDDDEQKWAAIHAEIEALHALGRPILVGTTSVAESERLSAELRLRGIDVDILNAKNDALEAKIVAEAGRAGAVTISTNMAGRGTDIRLGGSDGASLGRVLSLGGLHVIGTTRQESRRVDDQLRGRAGRQGDPGSSRFFVSLQDELLARFAASDLTAISGTGPRLQREIDRAQRIVDGQNYEIRRTLNEYSMFIEQQRKSIHTWRDAMLGGNLEEVSFAELRPARHRELLGRVGAETLQRIERELRVRVLDLCWSQYLAGIDELRAGVHLFRLSGRPPLDEFRRRAARSFDAMIESIDDETLTAFDAIRLTPDGVDWRHAGLADPSSTWTYTINDQLREPNLLMGLAHNPAIILGALVQLPLLFVWGLWMRMKQRRARSSSRDRG